MSMSLACIISGSIFLFVAVIASLFEDDKTSGCVVGVAAIFGSLLLSIGVGLKTSESTPSAIDVYRGNTTLQITYQDGVAIDSVVVFKNEKK